MRHNFFFATERANGHPAADDFAQTGEIRVYPQVPLRAVCAKTKACHHFIEDENRTVLGTELAHAFKIARLGQDAVHVAGNRFGNDAGNLLAVRFKRLFQRVQVVKRQCNRVLR